jgi:hypothetical protein
MGAARRRPSRLSGEGYHPRFAAAAAAESRKFALIMGPPGGGKGTNQPPAVT